MAKGPTMHILIVHPNPRLYHELLSLTSQHGASAAYARTLSAACDQIEARPPVMIVIGSLLLEQGDEARAFLERLASDLSDVLLLVTSATAEQYRAGEERQRLASLLTSLSGGGPQRRARYREVAQLRIDLVRQRAALSGEWIRLPRIEFHILRHLMENCGELVPYHALMKAVWGQEADVSEARELLKYHVRHMRRRLGPDFLPYLQSVRGEGYVLIDPEEET